MAQPTSSSPTASLWGRCLTGNGFRPGRWQITDDGYVVLASESGVLPQVGEEHIVRKGRLEPGKMFLIDTARGEVIEDDVIKHELATAHPYREWVEDNTVEMKELPQRQHINYSGRSVHRRQRAFGYTQEELKMVLTPMANTGKEPLGSMGNDIPLSVLSSRSRMLFDYFMQKFAQVTNPPLDWEREKIVTSIASAIGPEPNLLEDCALHAKKVIIPQPVLTSDEMAQLKRLDRASQLGGYYKPYVIRGLYQVTGGGNALETRLGGDLRRNRPGHRRRQQFPRALRPRLQPYDGLRSRRCCSLRLYSIICFASIRGPRSPWWWRPAMCVRFTMWRCSSPTARPQ